MAKQLKQCTRVSGINVGDAGVARGYSGAPTNAAAAHNQVLYYRCFKTSKTALGDISFRRQIPRRLGPDLRNNNKEFIWTEPIPTIVVLASGSSSSCCSRKLVE